MEWNQSSKCFNGKFRLFFCEMLFLYFHGKLIKSTAVHKNYLNKKIFREMNSFVTSFDSKTVAFTKFLSKNGENEFPKLRILGFDVK